MADVIEVKTTRKYLGVCKEYTRALAYHLGMVNVGLISGEWADPVSHGWRPPRVRDGQIVPPPHHEDRV